MKRWYGAIRATPEDSRTKRCFKTNCELASSHSEERGIHPVYMAAVFL